MDGLRGCPPSPAAAPAAAAVAATAALLAWPRCCCCRVRREEQSLPLSLLPQLCRWVTTEDNTADLFTKPVSKATFIRLIERLKGRRAAL
jgi:hypothetical protein